MQVETVRDYLSTGESLRGCWSGTRRGARSGEGLFGLTDRRLLFLSDDGAFHDVAYDHVCTVETRTKTRRSIEGLDYRAVVGGGVALSVLSFVGAIGSTSGLVTLVLVLFLCGGLVAAEHGLKRRDEYDGFVVTESPVQAVEVTTCNGRREAIEVPLDAPVATTLSRHVRAVG